MFLEHPKYLNVILPSLDFIFKSSAAIPEGQAPIPAFNLFQTLIIMDHHQGKALDLDL